jgi:hypothetical protein
MYYDRDNTNYYVDPEGTAFNYSAIFKQNVGIGTTSPAYKLDVAGTGIRVRSANFHVDYNSYTGSWARGYLIQNSDASDQYGITGEFDGDAFEALRIGSYNYNNKGLYILKEGNIGIGTTNPGAKLDVNGKAKFSSSTSKSATTGSILLTHPSNYQRNSIVFASRVNYGSDYGFIEYRDDDNNSGEAAMLTIGTSNDVNDDVYLDPTGRLRWSATNTTMNTSGNLSIATPTADSHATTKSYVDGALTSGTFWSANGDDIYNSNVGNVGIGIGTTAPGSLLTIANDNWVSSLNSSGTGYVNMFKVNSNNQLEFGTAINAGNFEFAPDSGFNTFVDMAVTATPAVGTVEGYTMKIDGNNILSLYSEADGSGGIQNQGVGIGTNNPGYKLDVNSGNDPIRLGPNSSYGRSLLLGGWGTGTSEAWVRTSGGNLHIDSKASNHIYLNHYHSGNVYIASGGGNVGIGTTNPGERLSVSPVNSKSIDAMTGRIENLGSPINPMDAATRNYVDSILNAYDDPTTGEGYEISGDLNMGGDDILGVNKLTVNTIDPLYEIGDVLYSSYAASVVGGVKEEYIGKTNINSYNTSIGEYEKVIDFGDEREGSELWLWHKTVDFNKDNVDVFVTPVGAMANVYYQIIDDSIILRSNRSVAVSYRLIGKRFDWKSWPTRAKDQSQSAGLKIE